MPGKRKRKVLSKGNLVAFCFQNGLGNFIMLTPAIQALCEMHGAKADIVLDDSWTDSRRASLENLCGSWPLINKIVKYDRSFQANKYKQLFYSRHGETSEAYSYFEDNAGYEATSINWRADKLNEVDSYMNEVYNLGYRGTAPPLYCHPGRTSIIYTNPINKHMNCFKIGLCNGFFAGSKWKWERKGWPHFGKLIELLNRFFGPGQFRIFLFGQGANEKKWANEISEGFDNVVNAVDRLTFLESTQLLRQCHLFITTDTGLMHVADAHNIPMIVLFGPTLISKNGPYNKEHRTIRSPLSCAPCQQSPAFHVCDEWKCMETLRPEMVMAEVRDYTAQLVKDGKVRDYLTPITRTRYINWWEKKQGIDNNRGTVIRGNRRGDIS